MELGNPMERHGAIRECSSCAGAKLQVEEMVNAKEKNMSSTRLPHAAVLAALITIAGAGFAFAQASGTDPHHPAASSQTASPSETDGMSGQSQGAMPGAMMRGNMTMQPGMMGGMPMMPMRGQMMKIMFAVADTDGDGALSFEEVTAVHKRIFDSVDANKDGKVTLEEMRAFMRD